MDESAPLLAAYKGSDDERDLDRDGSSRADEDQMSGLPRSRP